MRRYLLIAKRTMISRVSLDVPYFAEVAMKLTTPYESLRSLQANLSNVVSVDADISQRTIYWTDLNQKRIFAYQYATSMSSQNLLAKQLNRNSLEGQAPDMTATAVHTPGGNTQSNHVLNTLPIVNQTRVRGVSGGKKREQLGRNMTLIWKNMKNVLIDKVAGWVGTSLSSSSGAKTSQKKVKSTKSKQKQEKLIQKQKLSKLMASNRISKSAFELGTNVRTVHRVGIGEVHSLAVDTLGRKLYFTDTLRKRIEVSHLNGKQRKILIHRDLDR